MTPNQESNNVINWFASSPLPPVRIAKIDQSGHPHLVRYSLLDTFLPQPHRLRDPITQVFASEKDRKNQRNRCTATVTDNCIKGVR